MHPTVRPKQAVALLCSLLLVELLSSCTAYIPTGRDYKTRVVGSRLDATGKVEESIVEEEVHGGRFYPATVDGPFVSGKTLDGFRYYLRDARGQQWRLDFLERKAWGENFFIFVPLKKGRWIGVSRYGGDGSLAGYVEDAVQLDVVVFEGARQLFRNRVVGCYYNLGEPMPGSRKPPEWRPIREGLREYDPNYLIDATREIAVFRTYKGDVMFDCKDGSLKALHQSW